MWILITQHDVINRCVNNIKRKNIKTIKDGCEWEECFDFRMFCEWKRRFEFVLTIKASLQLIARAVVAAGMWTRHLLTGRSSSTLPLLIIQQAVCMPLLHGISISSISSVSHSLCNYDLLTIRWDSLYFVNRWINSNLIKTGSAYIYFN